MPRTVKELWEEFDRRCGGWLVEDSGNTILDRITWKREITAAILKESRPLDNSKSPS